MTRIFPLTALLLAAVLPCVTVSAAPSGSAISHVIVIELDNTHLDDLAQMPHLQAFLQQGTIFSNSHSVLNSRTQPDMVSFMAGAYPDKTGIPDQDFFDHGYDVTYSYWDSQAYAHPTDSSSIDMGHPYILTPNPWQQYLDHGWNFGAVEGSNMALENPTEVQQYHVMNKTDSNAKDYGRVAIHCVPGSAVCSQAGGKVVDNTLFGTPNAPWLFQAPLLDGSGTVGGYCAIKGVGCFRPVWTLTILAAMQAHGVPVTFGYMDSPHDSSNPNTTPYQEALAREDQAFELFFTNLAAMGITPANTLFVITSDEGDQFVAGGTYQRGLLGWMQDQGTYTASQDDVGITENSGPLVYMKNAADVPAALESLRNVPAWQYIATGAALQAIHNSSSATPALAARQPSFILYGDPNTWWNAAGPAGLALDPKQGHTKWDHGTIGDNINVTWMSFVGPGIRPQEIGNFVDEVDAFPTMQYLLGWPISGYTDGRILFEALQPAELPPSITANETLIEQLADAYKEINAPLGAFSLDSLNQSTQIALEATSPEAQTRNAQLAALVARRDALASQLQAMVNGAALGAPVDPNAAAGLLWQVNALMNAMNG